MNKILVILAAAMALIIAGGFESQARGPGDRERKEGEKPAFNLPQTGGLKKPGLSPGTPPVNRSGPAIQFRPQPSVERSHPRTAPNIQAPSMPRQKVQPQLNLTPGASQGKRPTNLGRPQVENYSKPNLQRPSTHIQREFSRPQSRSNQKLNAQPLQGVTPHRGQNFGRKATPNELRQFLNMPQGQVVPQSRQGLGATSNQRGFGKLGAAALGGAVGAVALDQMLGKGRTSLESAVPGHMPARGHQMNLKMTPRSAQAIRDNFPRRYPGAFTSNWWAQHPNLTRYYWHNHIWPRKPWVYWWRPATWLALSSWIAWNWGPPLIYNYGSNFYYYDNFVYLNGSRLCSAPDYYYRAVSAVDRIPEVAGEADQWMPLGVFALTRDPSQESAVVLQLAVNKDGIMQGSYYNGETGVTKPIKGVVEKENQRAVWAFADESGATIIMETGIYNLTTDETGVLVHLGENRTEQWFLARLNEPASPENISN